jgi:4-amino-4-deoxy-L-arabinose transferase-like glycosyltransferase
MKSTRSAEPFPRPSTLAKASVPGPTPAAHSLASPTVSLLAIVAVASGLRFALLGQHSLWADEAFVAWAVRFGWKDLFAVLATSDSHPPLYYALTKAWVGIAGTGEAALRIPSAVFSSLSVILTYALARRIAPQTVSLLSALVVAASPFDIMAAQEARMYPLLSLLAVGSTLALSMSVERGSARRWSVYVLLTTLMVYTHYLGFFIVLAHGVWVATWERNSLRPWLAGVFAAAMLYAPWGVALATRVADVAQLGRSAGSPVPYLTPDDVLALFAFGGSLFGTATYFGAATSGALEHVIVLLPFILVLGVGVASWWTRRRALGLIGLPLAITLGLGAVLALAKPVLWPRALSFLVPFYAILLAQGIVETAQVAGRHRDRALVLLGAGLLAYSIPVLSRHYFDPAARPYQWRAAAAWVEGEARTGDCFLYVGRGSADSFTYYFREPYPARTLVLRRDPRPTFTPAAAQQLAARYRRMWLVMSTPFGPTHPVVQRQLLPAIDGAFRVAGGREFNRAWVYLLVPRNAR